MQFGDLCRVWYGYFDDDDNDGKWTTGVFLRDLDGEVGLFLGGHSSEKMVSRYKNGMTPKAMLIHPTMVDGRLTHPTLFKWDRPDLDPLMLRYSDMIESVQGNRLNPGARMLLAQKLKNDNVL